MDDMNSDQVTDENRFLGLKNVMEQENTQYNEFDMIRQKCLEEVRKDGLNLMLYREMFGSDEEIVMEAMKNNISSIQYATEQLFGSSSVLYRLRTLAGDAEQYMEENEVSFEPSERDQWEELILERLKEKPMKTKLTLSFGYEKSSHEEKVKSDLNDERKGIEELQQRIRGVKFNELVFYRQLGEGAFGTTYLCRIRGVRGLFVMKTSKPGYIHDEKSVRETVSRDSLDLPYHPNVVSILSHSHETEINPHEFPDYHDVWNGYFGEKTEIENYFTGGIILMKFYRVNLDHYLEQRKESEGHSLSFRDIVLIFQQVLLGGSHLHSNLIVHRDIHGGNIFIDHEKGRAWIGDFGCALDLRKHESFVIKWEDKVLKHFMSFQYCTKIGGAEEGIPPEVIASFEEEKELVDYSKFDVYSIGVLGKFMCSQLPKDEGDEGSDKGDSQNFRSLLRKLTADFNERISFEDAIDEVNGILNDTKNDNFETMSNVEKFGSESHPILEEMIRRGARVHHKGHLLRAKEIFQNCLSLALKTLPENHRKIACCYYFLGRVKESLREFSSALPDFEKSLQIYKLPYPDELDEDVADLYSSVGMIHYCLGNLPLSEKNLTRAFEIRKKIFPEFHLKNAHSLDNLGSLYQKQGDCSKSLEFREKALRMKMNLLDNNDIQIGISFHNIGVLYNQMKKYETSLKFYEKCLEIFIEKYRKNHPRFALVFESMAAIHAKLGNYEQALENFLKSLEVHSISCPKGHENIIFITRNIGILYENHLDNLEKALEYYQRGGETLSEDIDRVIRKMVSSRTTFVDTVEQGGEEEVPDNYFEFGREDICGFSDGRIFSKKVSFVKHTVLEGEEGEDWGFRPIIPYESVISEGTMLVYSSEGKLRKGKVKMFIYKLKMNEQSLVGVMEKFRVSVGKGGRKDQDLFHACNMHVELLEDGCKFSVFVPVTSLV